MRHSAAGFAGTSRPAASLALLGLSLALTLYCTACGGNSANSGQVGASLEGEQKPSADDLPIPAAPTEAHGRMARLLPKVARINDSLAYCGWDAERALAYTDKELGEGAVKKAPMPCVRARFSSTGYELMGVPGEKGDDSVMAQTFPQVCDFYLIEAPAPDAAEAVRRKLEEHLLAQKFDRKDPLGIGMKRNQQDVLIQQFLRVDEEPERDIARVAYTLVIGSYILYALEAEVRTPQVGPKGEKYRLPTNMQLGSRVGAQVIVLVDDAIGR